MEDEIFVSKVHIIDTTKIETLEDVIAIIKAMNLHVTGDLAEFNDIKHLLKEKEDE